MDNTETYEEFKRACEKNETRDFVNGILKKWEYEHLIPVLQEQQKVHEVEINKQTIHAKERIDTWYKRSEMVHKNSTFMIGAVTLFATVFGLLIGGFGLITYNNINDLESKAQKASKEMLAYIAIAKKGATSIEDMAAHTRKIDLDAKGEPNFAAVQAARKLTQQPDAQAYLRAFAIKAMDDKHWQNALLLWGRVLQDEPSAFDALLSAAFCARQLALQKASPTSVLWNTANVFYTRAAHIEPYNPKVWDNWAILLTDQAKNAPKEQQETLLKQAEMYQEKAAKLKSSQ